jgi:hypothetical protein
MTKRHLAFYGLPFGLALLFAGILLAQNPGTDQNNQSNDNQNADTTQTPQDNQSPQDNQNTQNAQNPPGRPFIVNGKEVGSVVQMDGRSYVDVETLAQATNGSVTIEPNRVLLNLPAPEGAAAPGGENQPTAGETPPPEGLSREFARQAIGLLAEMREWRGAVGTILMYNVPVVGTWPQDYRDRVRASLDQVSVTAMTPDDEAALSLLQSQFSRLSDWADNVVTTRDNLDATNSVRPDALGNDPALAKISSCSGFLSSMLVSGKFENSTSCN